MDGKDYKPRGEKLCQHMQLSLYDKDEYVRNAVAQHGRKQDLDILVKNADENVRKTAIDKKEN